VTPQLTRREIVAAGGGLALSSAVPGWARRRPPAVLRRGSFPSGVMTGRPFRNGALLWTQLGADEAAGRVRVEVARDPGFSRVIHRGLVRARAGRDNTVLATVRSRRIRPGEEYFYRFETRTTTSPAGRFVTARPPGSTEPLKIGFFSCQDFGTGYYTAHAGLAAEECDAIVCLGDYIYETNTGGDVPDRRDSSSTADSGECELLEEYRAKYRRYRSDPYLRAMHASAPFVITWDDHEVEDNYAGANGGRTADQPPKRRIPFEDRRRNGYRAFFEQMPVVRFGGTSRLYRRIALGGMADVLIVDERQYRSDQTCNDVPGVPCPDDGGPAHTLLGREQMEWLKGTLSRSRATWKVLASSVEVMSWDSATGVPLNRDGWDGYPRDRAELGEHVVAGGISGVTVLTGDVHHFAAGTVTTTGRVTGEPWATEFVGGSVTSGFFDSPFADLARGSLASNPHQRYQNFTRRGYGVMELSPDELVVRYRSPKTIKERRSEIETIAQFRVALGQHDVEPV
jgi:alkaline phosphatase D